MKPRPGAAKNLSALPLTLVIFWATLVIGYGIFWIPNVSDTWTSRTLFAMMATGFLVGGYLLWRGKSVTLTAIGRGMMMGGVSALTYQLITWSGLVGRS